ncbi:MAG: D-amino acid aminotransferase [Acidocella sp. 20-63-7]|nr:MAG: D-amino acid aminotransferase [Acidocella sp. 20-63-7]HQT46893.1 D-amino-acid transaminase [Acidocella sp.]
MSIAYVNGQYLPLRDATVSIEDRGYQFGDGVYEVIYVHNGRLIDAALHLARLSRSLAEIELGAPLATAALPFVIQQLLRRNRISTGLIYIQVTRGVARRDHPFPSPSPRPSLVITARHRAAPPQNIATWAASAICLPDERWARCDIKSTNLLPNVLARHKARLAGAYEAILYDAENNVTEGAASSVWVVDAKGNLITRRLDAHILPGCTRAALITKLNERQIHFKEAAIPLAGLRAAREIFLTSASSFVKPITQLDGAPVGDGKPGPIATRLLAHYIEHVNAAESLSHV